MYLQIGVYNGYMYYFVMKERRNGRYQSKNHSWNIGKEKKKGSYQIRRPSINTYITRLIQVRINKTNPNSSFLTTFHLFLRQPKRIFRNPYNPLWSWSSGMSKSIRFEFLFLCSYIRRIFVEVLFSEFFIVGRYGRSLLLGWVCNISSRGIVTGFARWIDDGRGISPILQAQR